MWGLANDLRNLLSRTTKLLQKECFGGVVPERQAETETDAALVREIEALPALVRAHVEAFELNLALDKILGVVRSMNRYIAETAPFKVMKTDPVAAGGVLYNLLEGLRFIGALLTPVLPQSGPRIVADVGWSGDVPAVDDLRFGAPRAAPKCWQAAVVCASGQNNWQHGKLKMNRRGRLLRQPPSRRNQKVRGRE